MDEEKRQHDRYDCSGKARIQIPPEEPLYQGEVMNLSRGGCLIRFVAPQQFEIGERCELLFTVNQLPFRVLGCVRSHRDLFEYGFEFLYINDRLQFQLDELMEELKNPPLRKARVIPIRPRVLF